MTELWHWVRRDRQSSHSQAPRLKGAMLRIQARA